MKNKILKILVTFLIVSYPILNRYASPLDQITLVEFGAMLCFLFFIFNLKDTRYKIKLFKPTFPIVVYLSFYAILLLNSTNNNIDTLGTTLRLIFLYTEIWLLIPNYFYIGLAKRLVRYWATILSVYGLLQVVFIKFGIILSSQIPFLPILEGTIDIDLVMFEQVNVYDMTFRCRSLMTEPAMLCTYLIIAVFLELFVNINDHNYKRPILFAALYTAVCFISMSSTGIAVVVFVWVMYFYLKIKDGNKKQFFQTVFIGSIGVICGIYFALQTGILEYFISHTFGNDISLESLMQSSRFYALNLLKENSQSFSALLFGHGLGQTKEYLPGFARIYYTLGLIGIIVFVFFLYILLKKSAKQYRPLWFVYVVLNIGTEIILGSFAIPYTAFLMLNADDNHLNKK